MKGTFLFPDLCIIRGIRNVRDLVQSMCSNRCGIIPVCFFEFELFPICAIAMAFELLTYGLVSGIMYRKVFKKQTVGTLYGSLLIAMVAGRVVWGIVKVILSGIAADAGAFTFAAFISGALLNAIPGIVVQLILVPAVVVALQKAKLIEAPSAEKA